MQYLRVVFAVNVSEWKLKSTQSLDMYKHLSLFVVKTGQRDCRFQSACVPGRLSNLLVHTILADRGSKGTGDPKPIRE